MPASSGRDGNAVRLAIRLLTEPMAVVGGDGGGKAGGRRSVGAVAEGAAVWGGAWTSAMTTAQRARLSLCTRQEVTQTNR